MSNTTTGHSSTGHSLKRLAEPNSRKLLRRFTDKIEGLERRIAEMEAKQKASEEAYRQEAYRQEAYQTPLLASPQSPLVIRQRRQPPEGLTAMEAVMGKLDIKESPEELLAMLKALD